MTTTSPSTTSAQARWMLSAPTTGQESRDTQSSANDSRHCADSSPKPDSCRTRAGPENGPDRPMASTLRNLLPWSVRNSTNGLTGNDAHATSAKAASDTGACGCPNSSTSWQRLPAVSIGARAPRQCSTTLWHDEVMGMRRPLAQRSLTLSALSCDGHWRPDELTATSHQQSSKPAPHEPLFPADSPRPKSMLCWTPAIRTRSSGSATLPSSVYSGDWEYVLANALDCVWTISTGRREH